MHLVNVNRKKWAEEAHLFLVMPKHLDVAKHLVLFDVSRCHILQNISNSLFPLLSFPRTQVLEVPVSLSR